MQTLAGGVGSFDESNDPPPKHFLRNFPAAMRSLLTAAALLLAASTVNADMIVYEVVTTGSSTNGSKNNGGAFIGQSFNSGTNTLLTTATLEINREGLGDGDFTLTLHATTGAANAYFSTGGALASGTFSNTILSSTSATSYTFNNLNWAMVPNTVYMIGISSEPAATVKWTLNQSSTKNSSTGFITGYSGYNAQAGGNVDDGLHGATISAVPEPSTSAMAIVGLACGAWAVWRRRSV